MKYVGLLVPLIAIPNAWAQSAASDATLEEVVVTAEKHSQLLKDVPTAITAVGNEALTELDANGIDDYYRFVPALNVQQSGYGTTQVSIRGVSTGGLTFGVGQNPTVGIYVNNVPFGSSTALGLGDSIFPDIDPADLQRVEVLKGPQGTLYGASSLGGLLKFVTVAPDLEKVTAHVQITGEDVPGHDWGYGVRARVSLPLIENQLAVQISGFDRDEPGFINDIEKNRKDINTVEARGGRVAALWKPTDKLSVTFEGLYQTRYARDSSQEVTDPNSFQPVYGDLTHSNLPNADQALQQVQVYDATVAYDAGSATITSTTSYSLSAYHTHFDATPLFGDLFSAIFGVPNLGPELDLDIHTRKFTEEVRVNSSSTGPLEWQGGLFFTREHTLYLEGLPVYATGTTQIIPLPLLLDGTLASSYREYAAYGDVTYHFTDALSAQGGVRYSRNDQHSEETLLGALGHSGIVPVDTGAGVVTYLGTLSYKLTSDITSYLRYATGYRAGGPNLSAGPGTQSYGPDRTKNYEIGLKGQLLDRRLFFDVSGFHIAWDKIQLQTTDANQFSYFINGGTAVSNGFEATLGAKPVSGLDLTATAAYSDAHMTSDGPPGVIASPGSPLPFSPKFTGSLLANYHFPLTDVLLGNVGADYSYQGARSSNFAKLTTASRLVLPSYSVLGAHLGADWNGYSANLRVDNLTDKRGFVGGNFQGSNGTGLASVTVIQPRTVAITLDKSF
jgi:iron complex outermembrane recepter protein